MSWLNRTMPSTLNSDSMVCSFVWTKTWIKRIEKGLQMLKWIKRDQETKMGIITLSLEVCVNGLKTTFSSYSVVHKSTLVLDGAHINR